MSSDGLAYRDEGDPEDPAVVLLHGPEGDDDPWAEVATLLSPWMRVISVGSIGDVDATPREDAVRVQALLRVLRVTRYAVAGEGAGGPVAQVLALDGAAEAMVLVGSPWLEGADGSLGSLEVPALVVYGEDDPTLPATALAERFAEILPMASVAMLPGRGNALLREAPETVVPLVFQWLRSRYLKVPHAHDGGPVVVELGRRPPEDPA